MTGKICYIFGTNAFYLLYSLRNKIRVGAILKNQNGGQKSKMAARKITFYRLAPQGSIYLRHSINRKNSSPSADHFEKKINQIRSFLSELWSLTTCMLLYMVIRKYMT